MPGPLDFLKLQLPKAPEVPAEVRQRADAQARDQQRKWSGPMRALASGVEQTPDFLKGLTMGDATDPNASRANLAGQMVGMAGGLPFTGIKGLYSRVDDVVRKFPGNRINANRALNQLRQGASQEEIGFRGVDQMLKAQEGKALPIETIQSHLENNPLRVKVTELSGGNENVWERLPGGQSTRFEQYTLPGGENYRETLIQLDKPVSSRLQAERQALVEEIEGRVGREFLRTSPRDLRDVGEEQLAVRLQNYINNQDSGGQTFQSQHFPQPDILAHVRHKERNLFPNPKANVTDSQRHRYQSSHGAQAAVPDVTPEKLAQLEAEFTPSKGRFIEEIQSDWHEKGRDHGYQVTQLPEGFTLRKIPAKDRFGYPVETTRETNGPFEVVDPSGAWVQAGLNEEGAVENALRVLNNQRVPDAPFKESWPDLALKQQLLDVADRPDLDWIGWTRGQTQKDRYDLSQQVSRLQYDPSQRVLETFDQNGAHTGTHVIEKPEDLVPLIGKDAADRLMQSPIQGLDIGNGTDDIPPIYQLAGEDLQVGGRGMEVFYDEQLPNKMQKLLKPFGGKVEQTFLPVDMSPKFSGGGGFQTPDGEQIANLWPRWTPSNAVMQQDDIQDVYRQLAKTNPAWGEKVKIWYAKLSPEIKAAIKEKGLPLLSLYALMNPGEDLQDSEAPLRGLTSQ